MFPEAVFFKLQVSALFISSSRTQFSGLRSALRHVIEKKISTVNIERSMLKQTCFTFFFHLFLLVGG